MMEQKVGDAHMLAAGTNRRNYQMDNLKCLLIFSVKESKLFNFNK